MNGQPPNGRADDGSYIGPAQVLPELPPQMFTTAAHLLELTDKKVVLILRDGRKIVGVLRSWDQYANLVFRDVVERVYDTVDRVWSETPEHGTQIIRGENVVMLGEMDLDDEECAPQGWTQVDRDRFTEVRQKYVERTRRIEMRKKIASRKNGFEVESAGDILL